MLCNRLPLLPYLLTVLILSGVGAAAQAQHSGVTYTKHWINRTRVHAINVDLNERNLQVLPVIAHNSPGRRKSFLNFLAQHQPLAQITGTYFGMSNGHPVGDLMANGVLLFDGFVGTALTITPDNIPGMINIPYRWKYSWPGSETVVQGGIRLVQNGTYAVYPQQQGFKDPSLFRKATRTAVGIRPNNRLVMVATGTAILLSDLAGIMKELGCTDAMTLDGGASTGIAFGTEAILLPNRLISNVLIVVERPVPPAPIVPEPATPSPDVILLPTP